MGSNGRTSTSSTTDMVKIHVAVISILNTMYISTQARNVGQYAEEPMDRMKSLGLVVDYLAQDPKFVNILAKTLYDFQDECYLPTPNYVDPQARKTPSSSTHFWVCQKTFSKVDKRTGNSQINHHVISSNNDLDLVY